MEKELFDYVAERAGILATADTSKQETKDAAAAWKDAVAADSSDAAVEKEMMGEEVAAKMLEAQLARKEAGAKYCNCPSCAAASELLAKFGRIEL